MATGGPYDLDPAFRSDERNRLKARCGKKLTEAGKCRNPARTTKAACLHDGEQNQ